MRNQWPADLEVVVFFTRPYAHQRDCWDLSKDLAVFAILYEQGLGKTKVALDTSTHLYQNGRVTGLLVVAPNGVHSNWVRREIPTHLHPSTSYLVLEWGCPAHTTKRWGRAFSDLLKHPGLAILVMNVEAFSSTKRSAAETTATVFLRRRKSLFVLDESSRIKTPNSNRTKAVLRVGKLARYRRIMTGTPVTQSPFDLFSQFKFLDHGILDCDSYFAFRHRYGVWKTEFAQRNGKSWKYDAFVHYVRLDDLQKKIAPYSYRRTKAECLDLPEKIYQRIPVAPTAEQRRLYEQIMDQGILEALDTGGFQVLAPLQLTRLLRAQQILGGFLPDDQTEVGEPSGRPLPSGQNPKMDTLLDLIDDYPGKMIVWARFRYEIQEIVRRLRAKYGNKAVVEFHGSVSRDDRVAAVDQFQDPDSGVRFLVGQQASGIGVTLTAAETVVYYSNTFSYEQRYQSEDRCHRISLCHPVVYVDLEMAGTVDERIRDVLERARQTADSILGDSVRQAA